MSFINYNSQFIDSKDIKAVISALKSKKITQGNKVKEFEEKLKKKFKSKYCSVVSSGTAALHLSALALGFTKEDLVITSPLTFVAGPNSINYCLATPVFVDVDETTKNISIKKLEEKLIFLKKNNKKIKAVIATDYAGHPCDWKELHKLSIKYKFYLINDNCHAIGAKYYGDIGYITKFADLAIHSYHAVKNITTGEGGSVLTNNKKLFQKIEILKSHGLSKTKTDKNNLTWPYKMTSLGYNYRLTDFQSALGISQLKKLNIFLIKRKKIANIYIKELKKISYIELPYKKNYIEHAYHLFPIKINFKKISLNKFELLSLFKRKKINLQIHYFPVHLQPYYKKKFHYKKNDFPIAEAYFDASISLPIYYSLKRKEIYKVIKILKEIKND